MPSIVVQIEWDYIGEPNQVSPAMLRDILDDWASGTAWGVIDAEDVVVALRALCTAWGDGLITDGCDCEKCEAWRMAQAALAKLEATHADTTD